MNGVNSNTVRLTCELYIIKKGLLFSLSMFIIDTRCRYEKRFVAQDIGSRIELGTVWTRSRTGCGSLFVSGTWQRIVAGNVFLEPGLGILWTTVVCIDVSRKNQVHGQQESNMRNGEVWA